jgi:hypothetical protein
MYSAGCPGTRSRAHSGFKTRLAGESKIARIRENEEKAAARARSKTELVILTPAQDSIVLNGQATVAMMPLLRGPPKHKHCRLSTFLKHENHVPSALTHNGDIYATRPLSLYSRDRLKGGIYGMCYVLASRRTEC